MDIGKYIDRPQATSVDHSWTMRDQMMKQIGYSLYDDKFLPIWTLSVNALTPQINQV